MRRFKFIGTQQEAENYQTHIPKCGVIYDEDDFLGNLNCCPVSVWQHEYPQEWQEVIVSDSEPKRTPIKDEWISVDNRLTENEDNLLCIGESGIIKIATYKGDFYNVIGMKMSTITHWMPLPKPPIK